MSYKTLLTEIDQEAGFAVITLNRAESLNALCEEMMNELTDALDRFEADPDIGCIILTGGKKAFSGGAHPVYPTEAQKALNYNSFGGVCMMRACCERKPSRHNIGIAPKHKENKAFWAILGYTGSRISYR